MEALHERREDRLQAHPAARLEAGHQADTNVGHPVRQREYPAIARRQRPPRRIRSDGQDQMEAAVQVLQPGEVGACRYAAMP